MAVAEYYTWNAAGRPLSPCRPIRDIVGRMKVAYPRAASIFSWYADEAHYQAEPPEDHTPYSYTAWPVSPCPRWYVFATDIMHRPDLGVNCFKLFDYWIAEARAGRMPWLKYLIWQGRSYHVSRGWEPRVASGHFDHIHISTRTDHRDTSLGSWSLIPGQSNGGDDMGVLVVEDDRPDHEGEYYTWNGETLKRIPPEHIAALPNGLLDMNYVYAGLFPGAAAAGKLCVNDRVPGPASPWIVVPEFPVSRFLYQIETESSGGGEDGLSAAERAAVEEIADDAIAGATVTITPGE